MLEALENWYAKFPPSKKRGRSLLAPGAQVSGGGALLDDPKSFEQVSCAFAGPPADGGATAPPLPQGAGVLDK